MRGYDDVRGYDVDDAGTRTRQPPTRRRYSIRWYVPADREPFLSLSAETAGERRATDWFHDRYTTPYLDNVPIVVAETGDRVVAALPCRAVPVRTRRGTVLALQSDDPLIDPRHEGSGLFTRMAERVVDRYTNGRPAFLFTFCDAADAPQYEALGWSRVEQVAACHRIQNPTSLFGSASDSGLWGTLTTALAAAFGEAPPVRVPDRTDVEISRVTSAPVDLLARLYGEHVPNQLHALRNEAFFHSRLAGLDPITYVASRDGEPVAAIVTATRREEVTTTLLLDALPLGGRSARREAFAALVATIVADHADADVLSVARSTLPRSLVGEYAFHRDDSRPLSWFYSPTVMLTRSLVRHDADYWFVADRQLADPTEWQVSLLDRGVC